MNLYEAVFRRRSVRKYKEEKIQDQVLQRIRVFCKMVARLDDSINVETVILDQSADRVSLKGMWKVDAPYYLVFYSEEKPGFECNAGYMMQQILLYMTTKGIGNCYLGGSKIDMAAPPGMSQVMVAAFGIPNGMVWRDSATAKRLPLNELCVMKEEVDETMKKLLRAARLAPSALNAQPWRFIVFRSKIYIFSCKELFSTAHSSSMREFSMGIMMSHFSVASEEMWISMHMEVENRMIKKKYKSGQYRLTLSFEP